MASETSMFVPIRDFSEFLFQPKYNIGIIDIENKPRRFIENLLYYQSNYIISILIMWLISYYFFGTVTGLFSIYMTYTALCTSNNFNKLKQENSFVAYSVVACIAGLVHTYCVLPLTYFSLAIVLVLPFRIVELDAEFRWKLYNRNDLKDCNKNKPIVALFFYIYLILNKKYPTDKTGPILNEVMRTD